MFSKESSKHFQNSISRNSMGCFCNIKVIRYDYFIQWSRSVRAEKATVEIQIYVRIIQPNHSSEMFSLIKKLVNKSMFIILWMTHLPHLMNDFQNNTTDIRKTDTQALDTSLIYHTISQHRITQKRLSKYSIQKATRFNLKSSEKL